MESAPIAYNFINKEILDSLEQEGIPVRTSLPYAFNWMGMLGKLENKSAHAPLWLITLLYSEWSLMYWLSNAMKIGVINHLLFKHKIDIHLSTMIQKEENTSIVDIGTGSIDVILKWWLDDLALRIRAVWDKLPDAIAETSNPKIALRSKRYNARVNELVSNKPKLSLWDKGEQLLDKLISEMRNIDYIKDYRDAEAHHQTKRTAEVFGLYGKHETIGNIGVKLHEELNRCRESLMATISIILLR